MRVIIGLGNPGHEYEGTRHNIGFEIIDALAAETKTELRTGRGEYLIGNTKIGDERLVLMKPLTYMNHAGVAVKELVEEFHLEDSQILVLVDDFHLALGTLRLRRKGSSGGHHGLDSIIYHLSSDGFPRLRFGIAGETMPGRKRDKTDFVLSPFEKEERKIVRQAITKARDVVLTAAAQGLEVAISHLRTAQV